MIAYGPQHGHPLDRQARHTFMHGKLLIVAVAMIVLAEGAGLGPPAGLLAQPISARPHPEIGLFFSATAQDDAEGDAALEEIAAGWRDGYAGIVWDLIRLLEPPPPPRPLEFRDPTDRAPFDPVAPESPSTRVWRRLMKFLEDQTGERFRNDVIRAQKWIWEQPYDPHPDYALFKGVLYSQIDPGMRDFFLPGVTSAIRLDEINWGGVRINGIPPMEHPALLNAEEADYLDDDNIVFGLAINGEARAYPKRILAWYEMAIDMVGGVEMTIVYCTLCGTVIPYESVVDGRHLTFGTAGLLYRSNKLMFDDETKSLWSTIQGVPMVGPLVNSGVQLRRRSMVTTTWKEWRRKHPETTVLSLDTGHERDHGEGVAYRDYFATDALMFAVSKTDRRLKNKDEVVVTLLEGEDGTRHPLAVDVEFLDDHRVYQGEHAGYHLVILTSREGASRVYDAGDVQFDRLVDDDRVADTTGTIWVVEEDALVAETDSARRLRRIAAHRSFWFGWYAQFPETELVKR